MSSTGIINKTQSGNQLDWFETSFGEIHWVRFGLLSQLLKSFIRLLKSGILDLDELRIYSEKSDFVLFKNKNSKQLKIGNKYWNQNFENQEVDFLEEFLNENGKIQSISNFLILNAKLKSSANLKFKFERESKEHMAKVIEVLNSPSANENSLPNLVNVFFRCLAFAYDVLNDPDYGILIYIKMSFLVVEIQLSLRNFESAFELLLELQDFVNRQLQNKVVILYLESEKSYLKKTIGKIEKLHKKLKLEKKNAGFYKQNQKDKEEIKTLFDEEINVTENNSP